MDRQIVYVGAVPLDTDQLLQARNTLIAIGYLAKMTIGDGSTYADGLGCSPGGGLTVVIAPGSMTLPATIDTGSYGALPPDGDLLLKIGINTASTSMTLPGTGITLISACVVESQAGSAAIAYYNSANPTQTLIGVQGSGQAQATVLQARVSLAATGPGSVPAGFTPLWQIVVPPATVAVTASMISAVEGAPFVTVKLPQAAPILSPAFLGNPTGPTATVGDASTSLATTAFVGAAVQRNRAAWGSGGTYSWICPAGVSSILVRAWAAGGTGGAAASGFPGGGGGGGGYIEVLIGVTGGVTYALQIGSGTSGSTTTSFDQRVVMSGGGNGQPGGGGQSGSGGVPGAPVSSNLNSVASIGVGGGQAGYQLGGISIGGAGGASYGVQGATASFGGVGGIAGTWPGGGGSGGATGTAGRGADGFMSIEWTG